MKRERVQKKIADLLDFPRDVLLNLARVTLIGNSQLYIENHRGITVYEPNIIRIAIPEGEIVVRGQGLSLRTLYDDDIYIEGAVGAIVLEGGEGG